jgi:choline-sulfatase
LTSSTRRTASRPVELALDRRGFLAASALAAAGLWLPAGCGRARRPNFVVLFTDDQHHEAIGYASGGRIQTPHLDALARAGTIFRTAYANALPCAPSRGSLLSGRYFFPQTAGEKVARLRPGSWTWARALRDAGYRTGLVGKLHMNPVRADQGFTRALYSEHAMGRRVAPGEPVQDDYERWLAGFGLEDWQNTRRVPAAFRGRFESFERNHGAQLWPYDERYHPISWTRDRSIEFLDEARRAQEPFCLVVSFRYPHGPFNPVQRFAARYDPADVEVPKDAWDAMQGLPRSLALLTRRGFHPRDSLPEDVVRRVLAFYFALVSQIDEAVGALAEHVRLEDTLVLFTSDHGEYLGQRGRIGKHPWVPFEQLARVPFFAAGAGVPAGLTLEAPIGLVDVAPTLLASAGAAAPPALSGLPLQRYLAQPDYGADRVIYCRGQFHMLRRGSQKYMRGRHTDEEMLFDLASDPGEWVNLARTPAWRAARLELAAELDRVLASAEDVGVRA